MVAEAAVIGDLLTMHKKSEYERNKQNCYEMLKSKILYI